jgi:AbrB family looped-hinge helix DNA binding protein
MPFTHQFGGKKTMPVVKIKMNRQITIPKQIFDEMGLHEGEYVEVTRHKETVVVKPKKLVDPEDVLTPQQKEFIDQRLAEGLKDLEEGRVLGPFDTAKQALRALKSRSR